MIRARIGFIEERRKPMDRDDDALPKMTAGLILPLAPETAAALIDTQRAFDDDDQDGILPKAMAACLRLWSDDDDRDQEEKARSAFEDGLDKVIVEKKVVAGDWAAATERNRAIEEYRRRTPDFVVGEQDNSFIEPEWCHKPDPKPSTGFVVSSKPKRVSRRSLLDHKRLVTIAAEIRRAVEEKKDKATIAAMLREAKTILGHGGFLVWIERELPFTPRTVQNLLAASRG
jgi:hypothetical protein